MSIEHRISSGPRSALSVHCQTCEPFTGDTDHLIYLAPLNTPEFQAVAEDLANLHDYLWDYEHLIYLLLVSKVS